MNESDMRVRLQWKDDRERSVRRGIKSAEWFFLLIGLAALDVFVWVQASSTLSQAYADWSFDETLRGLKPSVKGFIADEFASLRGGRTKTENPETTKKLEPVPEDRAPEPRSLLGRLRIPRLNVAVMVREGADSRTLSSAVGHIPGTALPGKLGNIGLAGHRDTFFRELRNIAKDDTIDFETENGTFRYAVESTKIVGPRDVGVLTAAGGKTLTLVTCYPFYYVGSAPKRFIVKAVQLAAGAVGEQAARGQRGTAGERPGG